MTKRKKGKKRRKRGKQKARGWEGRQSSTGTVGSNLFVSLPGQNTPYIGATWAPKALQRAPFRRDHLFVDAVLRLQ